MSCGAFRLVPRTKPIKFNYMKKIFTLVLGLICTVAMFASDRRPTVTVTAARKFEIVIDGRHLMSNYGNTMSISNLFNGFHNIQVYQSRPGFFRSPKRLVASSSFQLRNNDVQINVDRFGQLQIIQSGFGRDWSDRDRDRGYESHDGRRGNYDRRF